jgi:hypothetical protein
VSGHATLPAGVTANIILNPPDSPFGDRIAWADHVKGDFEIRGIPSGAYLLTAWAETPANPSGAERHYSAETALSVDNADVTGLKIALEPHPEVPGHITIEGEKPIALHNGGVRYGFGSPMYGASLDSDNAFASTAPPGRSVVTVTGDEMKTSLVIKSIRMEQIDLLRTEMALTPGASLHLEIVLAPDGGQIEGSALDKDEKPVAGNSCGRSGARPTRPSGPLLSSIRRSAWPLRIEECRSGRLQNLRVGQHRTGRVV